MIESDSESPNTVTTSSNLFNDNNSEINLVESD